VLGRGRQVLGLTLWGLWYYSRTGMVGETIQRETRKCLGGGGREDGWNPKYVTTLKSIVVTSQSVGELYCF